MSTMKIRIVMLTVFAVCALGAVVSEPASASQWLDDGAALPLNELANVDLSGIMRFEDMANHRTALCGSVGGLDWVWNVRENNVNLGLTQRVEIICNEPVIDTESSCGSPEVHFSGLPWEIEILEPKEGEFIEDITSTEAAIEIDCTILGIKTIDKCFLNKEKATDKNAAEGLVESEYLEEISEEEKGNCSLGGERQLLEVGSLKLHLLLGAAELKQLAINF